MCMCPCVCMCIWGKIWKTLKANTIFIALFFFSFSLFLFLSFSLVHSCSFVYTLWLSFSLVCSFDLLRNAIMAIKKETTKTKTKATKEIKRFCPTYLSCFFILFVPSKLVSCYSRISACIHFRHRLLFLLHLFSSKYIICKYLFLQFGDFLRSSCYFSCYTYIYICRYVGLCLNFNIRVKTRVHLFGKND